MIPLTDRVFYFILKLLMRLRLPFRNSSIVDSRSTIVTKGFTLIELLVVIGVLTVLLAIVLIAVNPARQFSLANNTQRRSDVNAILNAVHQYAADHKGNLPANVTTQEKTICKGNVNVTCPANNINLCTDLTTAYLADLPRDPKSAITDPDPLTGNLCAASGFDTKYTIVSTGVLGNNRVTVKAPSAELSETIEVTR